MEEVGQDLGPDWAKWADGVVARDGPQSSLWNLYAIPSNANRVMKYDPFNNTSSLIGDNLGPGTYKWCCGIRVDNFIYGIPYCSSWILKIDTTNDTTALVGNDLGGGFKWTSGALAQDGCIYCMPFGGKKILCFDPATEATSLVGINILNDLDGCRYSGTVIANDGCLYGIPFDAGRVLKYVPSSGITTFIGGHLGEGGEKWMGGALASDGNIYGAPNQSNNILCINIPRQTTTAVGCDLPTEYGWDGATIGEDGYVYFTPSYSKQVVKFNPIDQSISLLVTDFIHSEVSSGTLGYDGYLYLIPSSSQRILRIDTRANIEDIQMVLKMKLWNNGIRLLKKSTSIKDVKQLSLRKKNIDGDDALCAALKQNAPVELIKIVVEANYLALTELNCVAGLYPFMLAAVGPKAKLEIVYMILKYFPGLMHDFVHRYGGNAV